MSALVIQTSFLGDVILTTPLLAALAARGPVDVVVTPAAAALLAHHPAITGVHVYDKRGADRGTRGLLAFARTIDAVRRRRDAGSAPGTAYLAQGSMRSATLAMLAGYAERVGFVTSAGRMLYTRRAPYRADWHHAERLWSLAEPNEAPPERLHPRLYPGDAERAAVDALLAAARYGGEPLIALAPGSVWATKQWPEYPALARRLSPDYRLVVVGGSGDAPLAAAIATAATAGGGAPTIVATGALSPLASAELLRRCVALVSNDSAPQHLASAVGTPTLSVFGPTVPEMGFGPLARGSATTGIAIADLPCRPCGKHGAQRCPLGHWRCMRELSADDVRETLDAVLRAAQGLGRGGQGLTFP